MGDGVFNISKGKVAELSQRVLDNDPAASILTIHLWTGAGTDATLEDLNTVALIEADAGFAEATFTAYVSKDITDAAGGLTVAENDTTNLMKADFDDIVWSPAGNGGNETLTRLTVSYDPLGTHVDTGVIPMTFYDFAVLTDGSDLTAQVNALGFFQAT